MSRNTIIFLSIFLIININEITSDNIKKCCKLNEVLNKNYECVENTHEYILPLIVKNKTDIDIGISDNCVNNNDTCIDKVVSNEIANIVTFCNQNETSKTSNLITIHKCCPHQMVYNMQTKTCDYNNDSLVDFMVDSESNFYNILYGYPSCYKVLMENIYNITNYEITNGQLTFQELNGTVRNYKNGSYCFDLVINSEYKKLILIECNHYEEGVKKTCEINNCVPKCCPIGYMYVKNNTKRPECRPRWDIPFKPPFSNIEDSESHKFYLLQLPKCSRYMQKNFTLFKNGTLKSKLHFYDPYASKYCIENFDMFGKTDYFTLICFSNKKLPVTHFYYLVGLIISIIFLCASLTIYFFLPELQNLHGRTVMCHTTSLLASYICLAFVKAPSTHYATGTCMILGYGIMFTFFSAFAWLNVMCFDIWWTFGVVRANRLQRNNYWKKFITYCVYAYGLPLILTACALISDLHPDVPAKYKPKMAQFSCWFNLSVGTPIEYTIFFIVPVATLIFCNFIFFVLTVRYCLKIRGDIQRMQNNDLSVKKRFLADKATLIMNTKLFIVMGITWVFEVISTYVKEPYVLWICLDAFNVLQGLWIFLIFVVKDNVWKALKKKLGFVNKRDMSQTQSTSLNMRSINAGNNSLIKQNSVNQDEKNLLQKTNVNAKK